MAPDILQKTSPLRVPRDIRAVILGKRPRPDGVRYFRTRAPGSTYKTHTIFGVMLVGSYPDGRVTLVTTSRQDTAVRTVTGPFLGCLLYTSPSPRDS